MAIALLRDDVRASGGVLGPLRPRRGGARGVTMAVLPCDHVPILADMACVVLDPAAARGRHTPGHMKLQYLDLVTALLLSESCMQASARLRLPAWSSVNSRLLRQRPDCVSTPTPLPASDPALHLSAPVRGVAVANASLGLA